MKKKKKGLLISLLVLVVIVGAATVIVGNYFVNFALVRKASGAPNVAPESVTSDEVEAVVNQNAKAMDQQLDRWLSTVEKETVSIQSQDGLKLMADQFLQKEESHKWVILIHGYTGNRTNMQKVGSFYGDQGYQVMTPDMRSHGESEGTYIGMGWLDRKDVLLWTNYILEEDPEAEIVLHGISMGGATVMMTAGEEDLPGQVKAVVEDCGYTSVWDIFADELDALYHLPAFPALHMSNMAAKVRAGYDLKKASALKQVKKSQVPILFIHGSQDNFVHTDMVYELFNAAQCEKDILVVEGAGHGQAYTLAPDLYFEKVFGFLEKQVFRE